jgi:hypothetical protein
MTRSTNRLPILAASIVSGALVLGAAGAVAAHGGAGDTMTPGAMAGGHGMMNGSGMAGGHGMMNGSGMAGGHGMMNGSGMAGGHSMMNGSGMAGGHSMMNGHMTGDAGMMGGLDIDDEAMADLRAQMADLHQQMVELHLQAQPNQDSPEAPEAMPMDDTGSTPPEEG